MLWMLLFLEVVVVVYGAYWLTALAQGTSEISDWTLESRLPSRSEDQIRPL